MEKYNVYLIRYDSSREFLGSTWAKSAAQACNNIRYRRRTKAAPHGGYKYGGMSSYEAIKSKEEFNYAET